MTAGADANYSINPWMRPEQRLGDTDQTLPPLALNPEPVIDEILALNPPPLPAGVPRRFLGLDREELTIQEVLQIGPAGNPSLRENEAGQAGTLRPAQNAW